MPEKKLQLREVARSLGALNTLSQKPLGANLAYRVAKVSRNVEKHVNDFQKARESLVKKVGKVNEKTGMYEVTPDTVGVEVFQDFAKELEELLDQVINLSFDPINIELFKNEGKVEPSIFASLDWLIID